MAIEPTKSTTPKIGGIDEWEVKNALDTLIRAEEHKQDKKMMKAINIELRNRQKAINKIINHPYLTRVKK